MNQTEFYKKRLVAAFSKRADTYDRRAHLQREIASLLHRRVKPYLRPGGCVLDIGSGTGLSALPLLDTASRIHALDPARGMISVLIEKSAGTGNLFPVIGEGESLPYRKNCFDLVLSSMVFHWMSNLKAAFSEVHEALKPRGRTVVALLGENTLMELRSVYTDLADPLRAALSPPFLFPGSKEVEAAMRRAGFIQIAAESLTLNRTYRDLFELLASMKAIGAGNPNGRPEKSLNTRRALNALGESYHRRFLENGRIRATFEILFCSGSKA